MIIGTIPAFMSVCFCAGVTCVEKYEKRSFFELNDTMAELVWHRPAKTRSSVKGCEGSSPSGVARVPHYLGAKSENAGKHVCYPGATTP